MPPHLHGYQSSAICPQYPNIHLVDEDNVSSIIANLPVSERSEPGQKILLSI